jgi:hypothetical protein
MKPFVTLITCAIIAGSGTAIAQTDDHEAPIAPIEPPFACLFEAPPIRFSHPFDAIVRVKISEPRIDEEFVDGQSQLFAESEATVVEVFKPHPFLVPGATRPVIQPDGVLSDHEWILRLVWDSRRHAFRITLPLEGAVAFRGDQWALIGNADFVRTWRARTVEELERALGTCPQVTTLNDLDRSAEECGAVRLPSP